MSLSRTLSVRPIGTSRMDLSDDDLVALEKIKLQEQEELVDCKAITKNTILTEAEYKAADDEFKTLIEIPRKRNEPISIMPEFAADRSLHPLLKKYVEALKKNIPYHLFIKANYGSTWPVLLQLYYGLKSGYKISIEQLHSMMKVSYWLSENITLKSQPFFENSELTELSPEAKRFMLAMKFLDENQKSLLIEKMRDKSIPEGERGLQVIQLDKTLCGLAVHKYKNHPDKNKFGSYTMIAKQLEQYYTLTYGAFDDEAVKKDISQQGLKILWSVLHAVIGYYQLFYLDNHPCIIFPTLTLEKMVQEVLHPERKLKYVRRLGNFSPGVMEFHVNKNERPGNLVAPGVTNPICVHRKICVPITAVEHDDYHFLLELHNSQKIQDQMLLTKRILRTATGLDSRFSSEIYRSVDREIQIEKEDTDKLAALFELIFKIEDPGAKYNRSLATTLILVDMVINSESWPNYPEHKKRFIDLLLSFDSNNKRNYKVEQIEKVVRHYAEKTNNNYAVTGILVYCHAYLKDVELCKALLKLPVKLFAWRMIPHGGLCPVIILNDKDFTVERFADLTSAERLLALKSIPHKKASLNVNLSLLAPPRDTETNSRELASAATNQFQTKP